MRPGFVISCVKADPNDEFPDETGLMILPWVSLFPGALMPLKIFEDRYQDMLGHALAGNRMFAIAHATEDESDCHPLGTIGLLRACVRNEDGTSNLVLQGVSRVEFEEVRLEPYPHSKIKLLNDRDETSSLIEKLRKKITEDFKSQASENFGIPESFLNHLDAITNHGAFTDMIASTVIDDPKTRRLLLEELDITSRMDLVHAILEPSNGL